MIRLIAALSLLGLALSACSSDTNKNSDGTCTQDFISAYDDVVLERQDVSGINTSYDSDGDKIAKIQSLKNSCDDFYRTHANISCRASVDGIEKSISSEDHRASCNAATTLLSRLNTPQPSSTSTRNASGTTAVVTDMALKDMSPYVLKFHVMTDGELNVTDKNGEQVVYAVGTKVTDSYTTLQTVKNLGYTYCEFTKESSATPLKYLTIGQEMDVASMHEEKTPYGRTISFGLTYSYEYDGATLVCNKSSTTPFLMSDISDAIGGYLEIKRK